MGGVESMALNWTFIVPVVGLVMLLWGLARRVQPLIWFGLALVLVVPALGLMDRVLDAG